MDLIYRAKNNLPCGNRRRSVWRDSQTSCECRTGRKGHDLGRSAWRLADILWMSGRQEGTWRGQKCVAFTWVSSMAPSIGFLNVCTSCSYQRSPKAFCPAKQWQLTLFLKVQISLIDLPSRLDNGNKWICACKRVSPNLAGHIYQEQKQLWTLAVIKKKKKKSCELLDFHRVVMRKYSLFERAVEFQFVLKKGFQFA